MQDWNFEDNFAGLENTGLESAGVEKKSYMKYKRLHLYRINYISSVILDLPLLLLAVLNIHVIHTFICLSRVRSTSYEQTYCT